MWHYVEVQGSSVEESTHTYAFACSDDTHRLWNPRLSAWLASAVEKRTLAGVHGPIMVFAVFWE